LNGPKAFFRESGLEFSDKPGAVGPVKLKGRWLKPLKFLGITYNPATGVVTGTNNLSVQAAVLIDMAARDYGLFRKTITGMNPVYSSVPPNSGAPEGCNAKSPAGHFSERYDLGNSARSVAGAWIRGAVFTHTAALVQYPLLQWEVWNHDQFL